MLLIVGLGNPGKKYSATWHNLGFLVIDELHKRHLGDFDKFTEKKKLHSLISTGTIKQKVALVKPQTFMNKSGAAVQAVCRFYKVKTQNVYIVHDDLDLEFMRLKISKDSSAGGHKGVRSIAESLKAKSFLRFRMGIRTVAAQKIPAESYVLKKFSLIQKSKVKKLVEKTADAVEHAIELGAAKTMNTYN